MKRLNNLLHNWHAAAFALLTATLAACTADPIEMEVGSGAAYDPVGKVRPGFYSPLAVCDTAVRVWVKPGEKFEDNITFGSIKPLSEDLTVTFTLVDDDNTLFAAQTTYDYVDVRLNYNGGVPDGAQKINRSFAYVPEEKVSAPKGQYVIPAGSTSLTFPVSIDLKESEESRSSFLVVLRAEIAGEEGVVESYDFYYHLFIDPISMRELLPRHKGHGDSYLKHAFLYIDPAWFDPRACLEPVLFYTDPATYEMSYYEFCDTEVIIGGTIDYNSLTNMPQLNFSRNLTYILRNREKYLKPVQDAGIKVTVEITGSGSGLGFCNLDDAQRASLVKQIQEAVNRYGLDGVNLNDERSGYGREGMPAIVPASYAKFIRDLRTALGQDKFITLTDIGEPAATLYQAQEGIEAGAYLDYAWTGIAADMSDPYAEGSLRKPIAGLPRDRYGRFTCRYRDQGVWFDAGLTDAFFEEVMEIAMSDDPRIFALEIIPTIEGAEMHTGPNLGLEMGFTLAWTENGDMPWVFDTTPAQSGSVQNPHVPYTSLPQYANMLYYPDWLRF